ncbi:arylsulfatase [Sphingobium sp. SJ10-10]|uniref:arylsulfatase n=1 Tax=Sphingobium sp. SJ10-10 TaxID=3114999 RepID=UPI002E195E9B|nr:arylsulfatase [Sphingobium sp. SJ10-10]
MPYARSSAALFRTAISALSLLALTPLPTAAQDTPAQKVYGRTPAESSPPAWPQPVRAAKGAPNILLIMTDDVGFGSSSTFGGPVPTPTFDALAKAGLRYNQFNTTAICSPTRASLLTGRNPQAVGMGYVANWATGYDGYNSVIPKSAGTVAQILKENGYNTAMIGKGHITPEWEMSRAGPFDRWPTGLGFEYFYGFLGADSSMAEPNLVENTSPVSPPAEPDYHLERDLADHAMDWIDSQHAAAPDKPFLLYYATGTAHAPNQPPADWLAKFRGKFDAGWDVLRAETVARQKKLGVIPPGTDDAPHPGTLPRWDSLTPDQKRLYARYMEAYAASLAYADAQIGRVIQKLRDNGELDNTLIIYIQGDNGASAEGSFDGKLFEQSALSGVKEDPAYALAHIDEIGTKTAYNLMPGGWGWAMNAPFPWAKRYGSHFGGTRNGMVMAWPGHIKDAGGLRSQFHHVSDIMPTVLEAAGVKAPEILDGVPQQPITGISMGYSFQAKDAPSRRTMQVSAMAQNLSIYKDGWVAATAPMVTPWERMPPKPVPLDERTWQLYDVRSDFSEAHDVAAENPQKLETLKEQFWAEAALSNILPIHGSEGGQKGRPDPNEGRTLFSYSAPVGHVPESAAPALVGRSFAVTAKINLPAEGGKGVLVAQGGRFGGYSLFFDQGRIAFTYNLTPAHMTRIVAPSAVANGAHVIGLDFAMDKNVPTSGAAVTLTVDGKAVAQGRVERTFAQVVSHTEDFDVGMDLVSPVDPAAYDSAGSRFNGALERVEVRVR